jgi:TonB family protein
MPGTRGAEYPPALRSAGKQGRVMVQLVVTTEGRADPSSVKILKSDDPAFSDAVRAALADMHFIAATKGGVKVPQSLQQPFEFLIAGASNSPSASQPSTRRDTRTLLTVVSVNPAPADTGAVVSWAVYPVLMSPNDTSLLNAPGSASARVRPDVKAPAYPAELRAEKPDARIMVQFVVDQRGVADLTSLKILKSDHRAVTDVVRATLAEWTFEPARVSDRPVKQLIQMSFRFSASAP